MVGLICSIFQLEESMELPCYPTHSTKVAQRICWMFTLIPIFNIIGATWLLWKCRVERKHRSDENGLKYVNIRILFPKHFTNESEDDGIK
jgi:hypothetical protein